MLWPGGASYPTQIIDVRDLANFTVDYVERRDTGIYNTVTPVESYTMGHLLEDSQAVSGTTVDPVWADEEFVTRALEENPAQNRGLFPIWHPSTGDNAAVSSVSGARARAAGLHNRPVRRHHRDLLSWWRTLPR